MRTSYSSLNTYQICPLKYKYQEIDKIKAPKGKEAVFGGATHEALRYMFKKNPLFPTLAEIINFFVETWKARSSKIEISEEEREDGKAEGETIIKNFYKKNQPWNFNAVDLESRFEFMIKEEKTGTLHTVAGIIDRLDKNAESEGEYEIIDYKTASKMPSQDAADRDLQMSIYHLGILKRWPRLRSEKVKLSLYFLKHNEKISTFRTEKDIEKTKNSLLSLINEILDMQKRGEFPPTPSALCGWCGYRQICPMWRHEYNKVKSQKSKIQSQNEIENIIKEYIGLKTTEQENKKRLAELQTVIHEFMNAERVERVFGENEYITRKIKTAVKYDAEKARRILEPLGMFDEIQKIDETALAKLLPKLPQETKDKFKEIVKETKTTKTLTISKIKK